MDKYNAPINILLTDDDADDRHFFQLAVKDMAIDSKLKMLNDGVELMEYLHSTTEYPDILFLDLNMPRKTGYECLKEIRNDGKFSAMAIAIYSTSNSDEDIENMLVAGANVYIHKPADLEKLKQIMQYVVKSYFRHHTLKFNKETFLLMIEDNTKLV